MLITDLEYTLKKNLRKVKGKLLRAKQHGVFSRQRLGRFLGALLLASFILGLSPEGNLEAAPSRAASVAGTPTVLGAAGQVKGEATFKALAQTSGRGPQRIPDSPDLGEMTARAALFVDVTSGTVLWERDSQQPLSLASTTKMMTALVALDLYPLAEEVTVPAVCASLAGTQGMSLVIGEKISVENLLTGMLVSSAGDAACALSSHKSTEEEFVKKMNEKAQSLGMTKTHFANPVGNDELDGNGNEGTAADLIILARGFWKNNYLQETVGLTEKTVTSFDGKTVHKLQTTNDLLTSYPGIKGIKTGYTVKAKGCFVSFYDKGGHQILGVLLGSDDRFGETKKVLDWIFAVYRWPI